MYRLLVTDLDGSIIDDSEKISLKNIEAVKILRKNNIDITIATGRRWASIRTIVSPLNISLPVILYNGAGVYDPVTNCFLFIKYLSENAISTVLRILKPFYREVNIGIYYKEMLIENKEALELMKYNKNNIIKIFLEGEINLLNELSERMKDYMNLFTIVFSSTRYLEVLPQDTSKGRALKRLIDILGVKEEEVIALGDYDNDEDLLKISGLSITFKNASEKVKSVANHIISVSPLESIYEIVTNILNLE